MNDGTQASGSTKQCLSGKNSVMSWTPDRDIIFCREVLVSNLFLTKKSSSERGKVWESVADKLTDTRQPTFHVDQRAVRDHYNKLLSRYKRRMNKEMAASGISPENTELDVLIEEVAEREEAAASEKENIDEEKRKKMEADKVAADDVRRTAMETLSESKKRKNGESNVKKRKRSNGNEAVLYLMEKAEMELEIKKEEIELKKAEQKLENSRLEKQTEQTQNIFKQQGNLLKTLMEQQQQQQQQSQAMQMMMLQQQQQQQTQALVAVLEKLSK